MDLKRFYEMKYIVKVLTFRPRAGRDLPQAFLPNPSTLAIVSLRPECFHKPGYFSVKVYDIVFFDVEDIGTSSHPKQYDGSDFHCLVTSKIQSTFPFWTQPDFQELAEFSKNQTVSCFSHGGLSFIRIDKACYDAIEQSIRDNELPNFPVHGILAHKQIYWRVELPFSQKPAEQEVQAPVERPAEEEFDDREDQSFERLHGLEDFLLACNPIQIRPQFSEAVINMSERTQCGMVFPSFGNQVVIAFLSEKSSLKCSRCTAIITDSLEFCRECLDSEEDCTKITCPFCDSNRISEFFFGLNGRVNCCDDCKRRFPFKDCQN